ncbi:MAG: hypothetical protein AAB368_11440, partial [bacterium]
MNPRAEKCRACVALAASALFFSWARPATGFAASTWLADTAAQFNLLTGTAVVGTQVRGAGTPAILELYRDWTTLSPSGPPGSRSTQGVWDAQNDRFFVFGGATSDGVQTNETRV